MGEEAGLLETDDWRSNNRLRFSIALALGLGLTMVLLWLLGCSTTPAAPAPAPSPVEGPVLSPAEGPVLSGATAIHYVAPTGTDSGDCSTPDIACRTIQYAVDQAGEGDEIRVAAGVYTGINTYGGLRQVVYISKTVTIRSGYTTTNWTTPDPEANPTTLDALGQGRVLYIIGEVSPTVEGLRITGGDATGLSGFIAPEDGSISDAGGGVYIITATAILRNNQVFSNTAGRGGGVCLTSSAATLSGNFVSSNTAEYKGGGMYLLQSDNATLSGNIVMANSAGDNGGGVLLSYSAATLRDNTVVSNTATAGGGGLCLVSSNATLSGNTVASNTAGENGGGLYLIYGDATLSNNTIMANTATWWGGGLYLYRSNATLGGNIVTSNTASSGGGLCLWDSSAILSGNTVTFNAAEYMGGGLDLNQSSATLSGNTVTFNTASSGGGLYLSRSDAATLQGNALLSNIANQDGGGVYLDLSAATLNSNTVISNTADEGGGLYLYGSDATLSGNTVISNTANENGGGLFLNQSNAAILDGNMVRANDSRERGGGLYIRASMSTLNKNTVTANTASEGGGLYLGESAARLTDNTITTNTANSSGGGGLFLQYSNSVLEGNTIFANNAQGRGGGLYLYRSDAMFNRNIIRANTTHWDGGGLSLFESAPSMNNNLIVENEANDAGSGLYIENSSSHLLHTTIARNTGGQGVGVCVTSHSTATLINTILASHTVGITVTAGSTATLEATLWGTDTWANSTDWGGDGTILTGTHNIWGAPAFVDPNTGDYHIESDSAAVNAGVDAGVTVDIDGVPRPTDFIPDIGADERPAPHLQLHSVVQPPILSAGQTVTYTLTAANVGDGAATHVWLTDTLPSLQRAVAIVTTQGRCIAGVGWGGKATCDLGTIAPGDSAYITLTVQMTTTPPAQFPQPMRSTAWITAAETVSHTTHTDTALQNCHVRLNDSPVEYPTVQAAVDASTQPADVVKIAGYCMGVHVRAGVTQTVYLSRTLTLQGGWNISFTQRSPISYPTTLDAWGQGRVLYITDDPSASPGQTVSPTIEGLRITGGYVAGPDDHWGENVGGGVYIADATAIFRDNQVFSNTASDDGGGLYLWSDGAMLSGNIITANTAGDDGGGLYLLWSDGAMLSDNIITANIAGGDGGGLYLFGSDATLNSNTVMYNTANKNCGGLCLLGGNAPLDGNTVMYNTANNGGGLCLYETDATLSHHVIAGNRAETTGCGLYIMASSPRLLHTTIVQNTGGDGSGVHVTNGRTYYSTVALSNTILVGHTVGITVAEGNTARLEATLWGSGPWANEADWGGAGTVITGTHNVWSRPGFVAPYTGDYHIGSNSAAIDAGVDAGTLLDMDGDPQPAGFGFDIGADERPGASLHLHQAASPLIPTPGQTVTYTLVVTSVGANTATHVWLTDTLPALQQAVSVTTTWGRCMTSAGWGGEAICDLGTMVPGDSAPITLTAQMTTSPPVQASWPMRNVVRVTAAEASNAVYFETLLRNCHVRLNDSPVEYPTVQAAVDASTQLTDVVKVAGYCMGVTSRDGVRQTVYLSKTLTLQGGWNPSFTQRNPTSYPTTLDAQGQGRVLYIAGAISLTVEGLRITGGDADWMGGGYRRRGTYHAGGGVYVTGATVTFRDNLVFGNTSFDWGGGLYLNSSQATFNGNTISANTAKQGGGLYLDPGSFVFHGNTVISNTASGEGGGGLHLNYSQATFNGNTISTNTASGGDGGGLSLEGGNATFIDNVITANTANGDGGGLYLNYSSRATFNGNTISANTARSGDGGGLNLSGSSATLSDNVITTNAAGGDGGGLYLFGSNATLKGNTISTNKADRGGGLYLYYHSNATMINNLVANNRADRWGNGLYIEDSSPRLLHTTVAHNGPTEPSTDSGGDGSGIYIANDEADDTVWLTNTLVVSQAVGLNVTGGNTVIVNGVLWHGTPITVSQVPTATVMVQNQHEGDPAFTCTDDACAAPYRISSTSAARDVGSHSGVDCDIDGQVRPMGQAYDLGADEYPGAGLVVALQPSVALINPKQTFTYTIVVTSAGTENATGVVLTGTLDTWQRVASAMSSQGRCTIADADWGGTFVCTPGAMPFGTTTVVTFTVQTLPTVPPKQTLTAAVIVASNETTNRVQAAMQSQNCHVRLNDSATEYTSVQAAVDAAGPGDLVKVAGYCMDVTSRAGTPQMAYITKTLTIQGGWNISFTQRNVMSYPTTLDAQGQGRVLYITGDLSAGPSPSRRGEPVEPSGRGSGQVVSPTIIEGLRITGGNAVGLGGGQWTKGAGGGVYVVTATVNFRDNQVFNNTAEYGGGLCLYSSAATLRGTTITSNTAESGGGLFLWDSEATLSGNTIMVNTAEWGGGVLLASSAAAFSGNTVTANTADFGGGLVLRESEATLNGDIVRANTAHEGGGLYLDRSDATMINNLVADNQAYQGGFYGGGLRIYDSSLHTLHTTVARNVPEGISILSGNTIWLTNTILVGHEVGIKITEHNRVTLEATLWGTDTWKNGTDWAGDGKVIIGTINLWGDPAFVNPDAGDYHIGPASAAIDAGVDAGVDSDIDGEPRPTGHGYDLGADEFVPR